MLIPEARGGHLGLTFSFVWIIVVSNIITVTICLLFLNQLVKITYVRGSVIIPIILLLVYLGTFAEKNAFGDLILMLIFGMLGWVMQRFDWPRPPFILGLVLGNLAESRLFLSVQNYGLQWLLRPSVLVIMAAHIGRGDVPRHPGNEEKKGSRKTRTVLVRGKPVIPPSRPKRQAPIDLGDSFQFRCRGDFRLCLVEEQELSFHDRVLSVGHRVSRACPGHFSAYR